MKKYIIILSVVVMAICFAYPAFSATVCYPYQGCTGVSTIASSTILIGHDSNPIATSTYTIPMESGSLNQILKIDGSGAVTWQDDSEGTGWTFSTTTLDYWFANTAGIDTDGLGEGSTNLYYTDIRVADYINASTTMPVGDWNTAYSWGDWSGEGFIDLTDLSGTSPIDYNNGTGAFSFDFSTANSWTNINTFTSDLRATGGLHASTTDFDMLIVNGNATTTGSLYVTNDLTVA